MSLIKVKPRPLTRDTSDLRDTRLFLIACDDTYAPKQYFAFFKLSRVKIHVVETTDGTSVASHVLDRLLQFNIEEDDERWLVLDTDHCTQGPHIQSFLEALKRASEHNVRIALSKPCFELWLLLHELEESEVTALTTASEVVAKLREVVGRYNKSALRATDYPVDRVVSAFQRAIRLDEPEKEKQIPDGCTTRVHLLWRAILTKALPSSLPEAFKSLLQDEDEK